MVLLSLNKAGYFFGGALGGVPLGSHECWFGIASLSYFAFQMFSWLQFLLIICIYIYIDLLIYMVHIYIYIHKYDISKNIWEKMFPFGFKYMCHLGGSSSTIIA